MTKKNVQPKESKKSLKPLFKFLGIFIGIIAGYYILLSIIDNKIFDLYLNITAHLSSFLINIFGENTTVNGAIISSDTVSTAISFGCEGTEPIIIILAGVMAVPIPFKKKWLPLLISIISIYFLNLIRIAALYFIQKNFTPNFEVFHTVYFPILFILFSIIFTSFSISWASKK